MNKLELDKKRRYRVKFCPCGKNNKDGKFVPFINSESFGYCHSCCETFYPKSENELYPVFNNNYTYQPPKKHLVIDETHFQNSIKEHSNHFKSFLYYQFDKEKVNEAIKAYRIGSSNKWLQSTVFWYIDRHLKVRTGKIMLYDRNTGKRIQKPKPHIDWVHSVLNLPSDQIKKCLFGEHLIESDKTKAIGVVESEKTAIIASITFPSLIWLATGGIGNLTKDRLKPLSDRKVILFPDLNAYDTWKDKLKKIGGFSNVSISKYLEENATAEELQAKYDLADFILKHKKTFSNG